MQGAEHSVVGHLLFPRDVRDRAADQLQPQPLVGILFAGCACRTNPTFRSSDGFNKSGIESVSGEFQLSAADRGSADGATAIAVRNCGTCGFRYNILRKPHILAGSRPR